MSRAKVNRTILSAVARFFLIFIMPPFFVALKLECREEFCNDQSHQRLNFLFIEKRKEPMGFMDKGAGEPDFPGQIKRRLTVLNFNNIVRGS